MTSYPKKNLCVIPAKGKSTRLKNKNVKNFFGKPIIYYPIKEALKSKLFHQVIVSTEDETIAQMSKKFGADIHIRNPKYADNLTGIDTVIKQVIQDVDIKNNFERVCCIFPTSVFFTKKNLKEAFKKLKKKNHYVFSASKLNQPIDRSFYKLKGGVKMIMDKNYKRKNKALNNYYYDAAQFYLGWRKSWILKKKIFSIFSNFIEFKNDEVQDIDDIHDWKTAKIKWKNL
jgi:N-acylneuraminate cytidylyltransferase